MAWSINGCQPSPQPWSSWSVRYGTHLRGEAATCLSHPWPISLISISPEFGSLLPKVQVGNINETGAHSIRANLVDWSARLINNVSVSSGQHSRTISHVDHQLITTHLITPIDQSIVSIQCSLCSFRCKLLVCAVGLPFRMGLGLVMWISRSRSSANKLPLPQFPTSSSMITIDRSLAVAYLLAGVHA